jgi:hypothetical protein
MRLSDHRKAFAVASLMLILIAIFPTLFLMIHLPSQHEPFSELWLLDLEHTTKYYPFNVTINQIQGPLYLSVSNHMGYSQYYLVHVKFGNQTDQLPNRTLAVPSPLSSIYEFQFLIADGGVWETPLTFSITNGIIEGNSTHVRGFSVNNMPSILDCLSEWDPKRLGYYYQLLFELWIYNTHLKQFVYHNRFVEIRLNVTSLT